MLTLVSTPVALAISAAWAAPATAQAGRDLNYKALAERIVEKLSLEPGERVLTVAHPGMLDILWTHVRYEVAKAGGVDLGVLQVMPAPLRDDWDPAAFRTSDEAMAGIYSDWFADADVIIMAPKYDVAMRNPAHVAIHRWLAEAHYGDDPRIKGRRDPHFHWWQSGGVESLPGMQAPPDYEVERVLEKAILEVDYEAIAAIQRRFEAATRGRTIRVTSRLGTDISFEVGDRGFTLQDGDSSAARARAAPVEVDRAQELPIGIARVAPIEESVNGVIAFPPSQWAKRPVTGLKLRFEKGRIVSASADTGLDAFQEEMKAGGDAATRFRDFSLGFNPLLAVPERSPWLPYYGYGAGVVRLGLGDNSELSGAVKGRYTRRNLFVDTTVTVGDDVWVKDGKLLKE